METPEENTEAPSDTTHAIPKYATHELMESLGSSVGLLGGFFQASSTERVADALELLVALQLDHRSLVENSPQWARIRKRLGEDPSHATEPANP